MKIILREHVDNLGQRGEVLSVAAGFARNYLLPKGLAYRATPGNIKQLDQQRRIWESRDNKEQQEAEALAARLSALDLRVEHKAGSAGTLYGAVTTSEIARMLRDKGIQLDRRKLDVGGPIKTVGEFDVKVRLHPKVTGGFKVVVLPEGGALPREEIVEEQPVSEEESD